MPWPPALRRRPPLYRGSAYRRTVTLVLSAWRRHGHDLGLGSGVRLAPVSQVAAQGDASLMFVQDRGQENVQRVRASLLRNTAELPKVLNEIVQKCLIADSDSHGSAIFLTPTVAGIRRKSVAACGNPSSCADWRVPCSVLRSSRIPVRATLSMTGGAHIGDLSTQEPHEIPASVRKLNSKRRGK